MSFDKWMHYEITTCIKMWNASPASSLSATLQSVPPRAAPDRHGIMLCSSSLFSCFMWMESHSMYASLSVFSYFGIFLRHIHLLHVSHLGLLAEHHSVGWIHDPLLTIHLCGHLNCLPFLPLTNKASMNISIQAFWWTCFHFEGMGDKYLQL